MSGPFNPNWLPSSGVQPNLRGLRKKREDDPFGLFEDSTATRDTAATATDPSDPFGIIDAKSANTPTDTPDIFADVYGGTVPFSQEPDKPSAAPPEKKKGVNWYANAYHAIYPEETRTPYEPPDRRSPDQRAAAARARGKELIHEASRPDITTNLPRGERITNVVRAAESTARTAHEKAGAQFSPEHWMEVARRGLQHAQDLHAQAKALDEHGQTEAAQKLHDQAQDVAGLAYNAQLLSQDAQQADTHKGILLSNLLLGLPMAAQKRNIAEIGQPGMTFSPTEQTQELGMREGASATRPFNVGKDVVDPLVASLPAFVATGAVGRLGATAAGVGLERAGAARLGQMLQRAAAGTEVAERIPTDALMRRSAMRSIQAEAQAFREALPSMLKRGAAEGQVVMGTQNYVLARQQGLSPSEAITTALEGAVLNVPMGMAAETILGVMGRAAGLGYDPLRGPVTRFGEKLRGRVPDAGGLDVDYFGRLDEHVAPEGTPPIGPETPPVAPKVGELGQGLDALLEQRRAEEHARRQAELEDVFNPPGEPPAEERLIEPGQAYRTRQEPTPAEPENPPLRTALDVAAERAGLEPEPTRPTDEANAVVQMKRQQEAEAAQQAALEAEAQHPDVRLEQAAQAAPGERQGPLTLSQTLARAARDAEQGEPMATEYRQAIDGYVDAVTAVKDAGEKGPSMKLQVALARAREALNAARRKYGAQFGASAVLGLAANDDDLTDDEKKMVGLAGLALSTAVVKHGEGEGGRELSPSGFYSRLRAVVGDRGPKGMFGGKKWDEPRPAADWIGKLKSGQGFSKQEAAPIITHLEALQQSKTKVSREDVLAILHQATPEIERVYQEHGPLGEAEDVDEPIDTTDLPLQGPTAPGREVFHQWSDLLSRQAELRRDLARLEQAGINDRINDLESTKDSYEQDYIRAQKNLHKTLVEEAGLPDTEAARKATEDLIEYIQDHVHGADDDNSDIDKAMGFLDDVIDEASADRDPEHLRQLLEDNGYEIHEVAEPQPPRQVYRWTGQYKNWDGTLGPVETIEEALWGSRSRDYLEERVARQYGNITNAEWRTEERPDRTRYEVRGPDGDRFAIDDDEDEAIQTAANYGGFIHGADRDELYSSLKYDVEKVIQEYAMYQDAESEHYRASEYPDDYFYDETRKIETWENEIADIERALSAHEEPEEEPTPAEPVAAPAAGEEGPEQDLPPPVRIPKRPPKYQGTQMIGGGKNYHEILLKITNPQGESYKGGHWRGEEPDTFGHARAEEHEVYEGIPGLEEDRIEHLPGGDPGSHLKNRIEALRREIAAALRRQHDIEAEIERIGQQTPEAQTLAAEWRSLNDKLYAERNGLRAKEDQETKNLYLLYANDPQFAKQLPPPKKVGVAGEFQSDQYQEARGRGIRGVTKRETIEKALKDSQDEKQTIYSKINQLNNERKPLDDTLYGYNSNDEREQILTLLGFPNEGGGLRAVTLTAEEREAITAKLGEIERQLEPLRDRSKKLGNSIVQLENALHDTQYDNYGEYGSVVGHPLMSGGEEWKQEALRFNVDGERSYAAVVGAWLLDMAERGYDTIAWSTPENRKKFASFSMGLGKIIYDKVAKQTVETMLKAAGMPGVKVRKLWINGASHWAVDGLTPAIRNNLRRLGIPLMSVLAMTAIPQEDAEAETTDGVSPAPSRRGVWGTVAGSFAAAAAVAAVVQSRKLRRVVAENETLKRALHIDDLSGLANRKALAAARQALDADPKYRWVVFDGDRFKKLNDAHGHAEGDKAIQHFGTTIRSALTASNVAPRAFRVGGDEFAVAVPAEFAQAVVDAVERGSSYSAGAGDTKVTTKLTGAHAPTFDAADALLLAKKREATLADPSLRRTPSLSQRIVDAAQEKGIPLMALTAAATMGDDDEDKQAGLLTAGLWSMPILRGKKPRLPHPDVELQYALRTYELFRSGEGSRAARIRGAAEWYNIKPDAVKRWVKMIDDEGYDAVRKRWKEQLEERHAKREAFKAEYLAADAAWRKAKKGPESRKAWRALQELKERNGGDVRFYANPIGLAVEAVARNVTPTALAALGYELSQYQDDPKIKATGAPVLALAAITAIGSRRLRLMDEAGSKALVNVLKMTETGERVGRAFNPTAFYDPRMHEAVLRYEREGTAGEARAAELARRSADLGPEGDRAVSDVGEGEQWEDTSHFTPEQTKAVIDVAAEIADEWDRTTQEQISTGAMEATSALPDYFGPRRYAEYEGQQALAATQAGTGKPASAGIRGTKTRTLDIPVREAEEALRDAQARGNAAEIQDARDALDQAKLVQYSRRTELGEIREASYRTATGLAKAKWDAAAARLFTTLDAIPGVVHPEWKQAVADFRAAQAMLRAAATPTDKAAAKSLVDEAKVAMYDLGRKYGQKGSGWRVLPDTRRYGSLRGAVVTDDVFHDLEGFSAGGGPKGWQRLLQGWKEIHTVFNPGTHVGNVMSNVTVLHVSGGIPIPAQPFYLALAAISLRQYDHANVSPKLLKLATKLSRGMRRPDEAGRLVTESGMRDVNTVTANDLGMGLNDLHKEEGLQRILDTTRPETADVLRRTGITEERARRQQRSRYTKAALAGAALGAAKGYEDEEPSEGLAGAAIGAAAGMGVARIARGARRVYNNEDNLFRAALYIRARARGVAPDLAEQEVLSAFGDFRTRSPALHVLRTSGVAPFILWPAKMLPNFAMSVVDHPWRYLTLMGTIAALDQYGKSQQGETPPGDIPVGQRSQFGYFFPGMVRIGKRGPRGEVKAEDVSRWTPMSAATTAAPPGSLPAAFDETTPDIFRASGPWSDVGTRILSNIDPFTKKPTYNPDYPPHMNAAKLASDVANTALPPFAAFHESRIAGDVRRRDTEALKTDILGPVGLRPRLVRPGQNVQQAAYQLDDFLRTELRQLKRDMANNRNPDRNAKLVARYLEKVKQSIVNFRERVGVEPPPEIVREYLQPPEP